MYLLQKDTTNLLKTHFDEWDGFHEWIQDLHDENIEVIYLSSTNTEPTLYKYLGELITFLQDTHGFRVGIRSNASTINKRNIQHLVALQEEVSLSLQSFNPDTFIKITGTPMRFDIFETLEKFRAHNKHVRLTIVVNQYNYKEIPDMLRQLSPYKDIVDYVQLRKFYKYHDSIDPAEQSAWDYVYEFMQQQPQIGNYYESPIYQIDALPVSLWYTVFKPESVHSNNYWVNGVRTKKNLLVEGYDEGRTEKFKEEH
jgi:wyosine [tRNA(Phe)-imidazoG37] synthetase (radical SAM superfamily)